MNSDSRFVSGPTQSHLMTSLMEYGSMKTEPLQALLASTHARSRSPWQPLDEASSAWQHAFVHQPVTADDIANKSFQPWRWHSELPFDSCMATLNKSVGVLPSPTSSAHSGNDQRRQQQQHQSQQHQQSWAASMYGGPRLWPTSYADCDTGCYQRQPAFSAYGSTGANDGDIPMTSLSSYPLIDGNRQSYPGSDGSGSSCVDNGGRSPTTSAAVAAAARMQAVARYFNDRWYSAAATGYGSSHPCFDSGNGINSGGGTRMPNGNAVDETSGLVYASMAGRQSMSSSISGLQQTGSCPPAIAGFSTGSSLLPPSDVASVSCNPFASRWMWNGAATCGMNANYALNNCSQLAAGSELDRKHSSMSDFHDETKNDFRYSSSGVGGCLSGTPYMEMGDGKGHSSDRKLSPETKKRRMAETTAENRHPLSLANSVTSSSPATTTTTQRAPRPAVTGVTSASGGGNRSTASACECPNCREADRIGGTAGEQLRRLGQHSCHVPGCGKVYGKTSHLKAHLHWHNAGSSAISTGNSAGNAAREPTSACNKLNVGDQRYDVQRHQTANGGEFRSQSDRLVATKRSRKKSRTEVTSGKVDSSSNSTSAYNLGQPLSDCSVTSCNTMQRCVSSETVFDAQPNATRLGGRYDRVTGTGSSPTTDDNNIRLSPRNALKHSPDTEAMLRKQDSLKCRRTASANCDDLLLSASGRIKPGGSSSLETGSACSNERLTVLTANG